MDSDTEFLVFGLDVGTTQSGAAVTYVAPDTSAHRAPTVLEKLPGQTPGRAKIPSVLLYDKQGNCQEKWGSQLSDLSKDEKTKIKKGEWQKVEWFKLHIDPLNLTANQEDMKGGSRSLPAAKIGAEVWGDFLKKLSSAAKQAAQEELGITWIGELEKRGKVIYVVTIPVAWQQDPGTMSELRLQARRIGLIRPDNAECLKFCSESEASALHCYEQTKHLVLKQDDVFVMMDAGGGTVDFTSYKITQLDPLQFEEVGKASKVCLFAGSTFVDKSFEKELKEYLSATYPLTKITDRHIQRAMDIFVSTKKLGFTAAQKTPGFWDISSDDDDYDEGGVEIPWETVEAAFLPHVTKIVSSIMKIIQDLELYNPQYLFCSGGFGDSPYLRGCLEESVGKLLKVVQPEQTSSSSGSKAVSLGACMFGSTTWVSKRTVQSHIGISAMHTASESEMASYPKRIIEVFGDKNLTGLLSVIVSKDAVVKEGEYEDQTYIRDFGLNDIQRVTVVTVYSYGGENPPQFTDGAGVEKIGQFKFVIPSFMKGEKTQSNAGISIIRYHFRCRIYCGETELRSEIIMDGKKIGQSSFLEGGFEPTSVG